MGFVSFIAHRTGAVTNIPTEADDECSSGRRRARGKLRKEIRGSQDGDGTARDGRNR